MNPRRFLAGCACAFVGLIAAAAVAAIVLKGAPLLPKGVAEAFAGAEQTAPPEPSPSPSPAPRGAAVVCKGQTLAVLEDAASAGKALSRALEIAARRIAQAAGGEAVQSAFLTSPVVQPAEEGAAVSAVEQAAQALGAENSPLEVCVTVRTYETENVAFEIKTEKVASLPPGARLIKSYGRDGRTQTAFDQSIRGGVAGENVKGATAALRESVPREILLGKALPAGAQWGGPPKTGLPQGISVAPPVDARIAANFGGADGNGRRYGVDYNAAEGASVRACEAGVVVAVLERAGYGLTVEIDHGGGVISRCAKLKEAGVAVGDRVGKGDPIGAAAAKGPRFELWMDGIALNPKDYIK